MMAAVRNINVRHINWNEIDKSNHNTLLEAIHIGGCVESLPFDVPEGLKSIKIPIYGGVKCLTLDINATTAPATPILQFERIKCINSDGGLSYVWERAI